MTISGQAAAVHRPQPAAAISGSTRLVGLIGEDVRYSLSLRLHNHAFAALGLDWAYLPLPVAPGAERLGDALRGLRAMGFAGANITMPHKEAVLPLLDEISPSAARIGAVNTIRVAPGGALVGENTDAEGFISDLRAHGVDPSAQPALLLGAGGAARAVAVGLAESGCYDITIANRSPWRAERLALDLAAHFPRARVDVLAWDQRAAAAAASGLVVNCTPVGMAGVRAPGGAESPFPGSFSSDQVVVDLVYAPLLTPMLAAARRSGAQTLTGLGMLVRQAALSFACWTRHAPPVRHMQDAIQELLS